MIERKGLVGFMSVVLLCAVFIATGLFSACDPGDDEREETQTSRKDGDGEKNGEISEADYTIVLDAGHGGVDPGKVAVDGGLEKDINLQIVLKLKEILERNNTYNIEVVLTRSEDAGHYKESDSNKKMADMTARCNMVNEAEADMLVSIHQNSYHSSAVKGAQVFYYEKSEQGHKLATMIQNSLINALEENGQGRVEKSNDNYYILLNVDCPAVIVECGFLSNPEEALLLQDDAYQEKVAMAVEQGIIEFLTSADR